MYKNLRYHRYPLLAITKQLCEGSLILAVPRSEIYHVHEKHGNINRVRINHDKCAELLNKSSSSQQALFHQLFPALSDEYELIWNSSSWFLKKIKFPSQKMQDDLASENHANSVRRGTGYWLLDGKQGGEVLKEGLDHQWVLWRSSKQLIVDQG